MELRNMQKSLPVVTLDFGINVRLLPVCLLVNTIAQTRYSLHRSHLAH